MTGTVKWFDDKKGFGFLTSDEGQDFFVHHTGIVDQKGHRTLTEQQRVEFEIEQGERGPKAVRVRSAHGINALCPAKEAKP